jgi:signal transduction histidine kinase
MGAAEDREREPETVEAGLKQLRLQGLFGHLCASSGLYSKETFLTLYGCIVRLVRDHRLSGFVMTRTLDDPAFETIAHALEDVPGLPLHRFNQSDLFRPDPFQDEPFPVEHRPSADVGGAPRIGFLIMLTDRLCAALFWSEATQNAFRLFEGGWTFHPGDTRTMAVQLIARLAASGLDVGDVERLLRETEVDRRYDDKLNVLTTSLVQGLENRNRDLVMALDQLKRLNKRNVDTERLAAIGQLSSTIAHEIRNPLGLIDLYAKLTEDQLARLAGDEEKAFQQGKEVLLKNLALIRQSTASLEGILSELTDYSRPLRLSVRSTSMRQLVRDVCEFYRPSYVERGVRLEVSPEGAGSLPDMLPVDSEKIRQALINLLKNALEACTEGQAVTVRLMHRVGEAQLYLTVADEGCGVDPRHAQKLFTPYFSTKGSGTGLGLAHSRKILQAHGGSVELLSSTPGRGSVFALILPCPDAESGDTREVS